MVMVTENETRTAMTTARFTWGWHKRLTNRISSLFRTVRTPRSSRLGVGNDDDDNTTGVHSLPAIKAAGRHKSASEHLPGPERREKAKARAARSVIIRNDTTPNMDRRRDKSIERWARSAANGFPQDPNSSSVRLADGRRGSETLIPPGEIHAHFNVNSSRSTGSQSRPPSGGRDNSSTPLPNDERPRHRFSLSSMWRHNSSHKTPSQASSPLDSSSGVSVLQENTLNAGPSVDIMARRSDEVLRHHGKESLRSMYYCPGVLTAARRASSWGDPVNYVEDVTSLNSGEQDGMDDDAMFLGAGGVEPTTLVSNLPLGLGQATEAINYASTALRHPQPERLHLGPSVHICCDVSNPQDSASNRHHRSTTTSPSPLHHVAYESDLNTSEEEYEDLDSDSSFFGNRCGEREREAFRANASHIYEEEDDEESDEEIAPIEFKRRRPSVSVTAASPPPLSDLDDGRSR